MIEAKDFTQKLTSLLAALPTDQLADLARSVSRASLTKVTKRELGERTLEQAVALIFPEFAQARIAEVARLMRLNAVRNTCWKTMMFTSERQLPVIACPDPKAAQALRERTGPTILGLWHFGPLGMLPFALESIGVRSLIVTKAPLNRWTRDPEEKNVRIAIDDGDFQTRTSAVRRALTHLKGGGTVAIAIDGSQGQQGLILPFLGRQFAVSRGAAALARLTGASIVPCTMQWGKTGWKMAIRVFEALPRPSTMPDDSEAFERNYLAQAVRSFEQFARAHPAQLKLDQLAKLINAPRMTS